jgi:ketosteroid isomerase-like protein
MKTTVGPEEIASELRRAWAEGPMEAVEALCARVAKRFEVRHDPPQPADGFRDAEVVHDDRVKETRAFARAMSDYREEADVSTTGNEVIVDFRILGTLPDGVKVRAAVHSVYRVEAGKLVGVVAHVEEGRDLLIRALHVGGFEFPAHMRGPLYDMR